MEHLERRFIVFNTTNLIWRFPWLLNLGNCGVANVKYSSRSPIFALHCVFLRPLTILLFFHFHKHTVELSHFHYPLLIVSQNVLVVRLLLLATSPCPLVKWRPLGCIYFIYCVRVDIISDIRSIKFL